jgi:hypothetical protein
LKEGSLIPYALGVQHYDDRVIVDASREGEYAQAKLIIRNLMRSDDGLYACIARNAGGNYTKNGHVTVEFAPTFALTPMREAWSWDGHLVNLTCRAESIPNATVSWFLNGRNLENDYNTRVYNFNGESTLTVRSSFKAQFLSNTLLSSGNSLLCILGHSCGFELLWNLSLLGYEYSRQRRACHRVARSSHSRTSPSNKIRNHHWLVLFICSFINWQAQVTCAVFNFRFFSCLNSNDDHVQLYWPSR